MTVYGRIAGGRLARLRLPDYQQRRQPGTADAPAEVTALTDQLCELFTAGTVGSVHLLYHRFESALAIHPVVEQLLPLTHLPGDGEPAPTTGPLSLAAVEPSPQILAEWLIPEWLYRLVHNAFLNSLLSEAAARQRAMSRASENAKTMVGELTMQYRRLRQESITAEMLELSGGTLV
jgi:F-type H+-transporting ATPase subunit gamma